MDPISAIGVAASVAQFLSFGCKVASRLQEYSSTSADVPKSLQHISAQLPLLLNALERVKTSIEVERIDLDTRCILKGVVSGCTQQISKIEKIIDKVLHVAGDSLVTRVQKVFVSIKNDEKVLAVERSLQTYIQVLILHKVIEGSDDSWVVNEDSDFFEVRVKKVMPFFLREEIVQRIETAVNPAVTSQAPTPIYVMLLGRSGVGKTQLAVDFCHQANAEGQFRTIFWANASTAESLCRSLESISDVIRKSKEGLKDREQKINFVNSFLCNRWHPWLLVLDGFDPGGFASHYVRQFLPAKGSGVILFTSRSRLSTRSDRTIEVPQYRSPDEMEELGAAMAREVLNGDIERVKSLIADGADPHCRNEMEWCCLHLAVRQGDTQMVKLLLQHGANSRLQSPSYGEPHGHSTALYRAAEKGNVEITKILLDHEDAAKLSPKAPGNNAALMAAATKGYPDVVRMVIEHGSVDVNTRSPHGERALGSASEKGQTAVVKMLLSYGANVSFKCRDETPLVWATQRWHLETVKALCEDGKALVNEIIDSSGPWQPPLWHAAYPGYIEGRTWEESVKVSEQIVKYLLESGADPNSWNKIDMSPLQRAAERGVVNVVQMLLEYGADAYAEEGLLNGCPPIVQAVRFDHEIVVKSLLTTKTTDIAVRDRVREQAILNAAIYGKRNMILVLLDEGVDINAEGSDGKTPLIHAIEQKTTPTARFLIRRGARVDKPEVAGRPPLFLAVAKGLDTVVQEISNKTKSPDVLNADGDTALCVAASIGHKDVVEVLLKANADRHLVNRFGDSPLDLAVEGRHQEVAAMLEE